ncbi:hypothetical protein NVP1133O_40 [Vibrio phage 1.133.O._10N.222.51.E4]|nr:hypothetical protein NVP1133O_40 [Vibrio phage 1.133.O._10N.222.51.E4]
MSKTAKKDMIGKEFGRLTVILELADRNKNGHILYECSCSCGASKVILGSSLRAGTTTSCGCYNAERHRKHGMEGTGTYKAWQSMKQRCRNVNHARYYDWGGRGIDYCDDWESFDSFFSDMGARPDGMTIDRIDNDKGYSKENCRWVTPKQQCNNRRSSIRVMHNGIVMSISEYANSVGLSESGARKRVKRTMTKINGSFVKEADL